jgi:hypothetical protein
MKAAIVVRDGAMVQVFDGEWPADPCDPRSPDLSKAKGGYLFGDATAIGLIVKMVLGIEDQEK